MIVQDAAGVVDNGGDMTDAFLASQVLSGTSLDDCYKEADVNGDGRIGMEEVIYILQKISGLRN